MAQRETTRRGFLGMLGAAGTIVLLPSAFAACGDTNAITDPTRNPALYRLDLSIGTGILNYLYALEQLEAVFYSAALSSPGYSVLSAAEQAVFSDIQKQEVIQRELLRQMLLSAAIPSVAFNATTVANMMTDRSTLLKSAQYLEDTGVSAYNGAAQYLSGVDLLVASKIASVEARHAAAIRDIRDGTNGTLFAGHDVVDANGLDVKAEPSTVLAALGSLNVLVSPLSIGTLPDQARATPDEPAPIPA